MKLVTSKQMRGLDRAAIEKHGIASLDLMERAGRGVAKAVASLTPPEKGTVAIIAGRGNNGGDGLVAARHLISMGYEVAVWLLAGPSDLSPDARANWELLAPLTTHLFTIADIAEFNSRLPLIERSCLIVDAILGTGLDRDVAGLPAAAIAAINAAGIPVVSVDIPSGLSADTGKPLGAAVRAAATVTFGLPKMGLVVGDGPVFSGSIKVVDIGIPGEETDRVESLIELIEPSMFASHFGKRDPSAHKGAFGHVVVYSGSLGHLGAGYLGCLAALRAGCGLVTYCLPEKAFVRFDARYPEVMCDPIADDASAHFHPKGLDAALRVADGKSVAAIGPAIGTEKSTREFVNSFIGRIKIPLVIDADGLNVLDLSSLRGRRAATILTPHPGEMGRLSKAATEDVQADRVGHATRFAKEHGVTLVLKGRGTVVASPDGSAAINHTGNAGMATAGMGDALTGIVASFIAQGMDVKTACVAAVYIHGLAGDMAAAEHGERALITSDVIGKLGKAMKKISPSPL
ncbi:MAG: NAD(P)H-hydrate dehydratase [Pseudomonadota bacterium]